VVFSPDGTRIASGSDDSTVRLHDAASWRQVLVLRGHRNPVRSVAFSPDGGLLASGAGGWEVPGTVKLWEIPE
jgi:WD40 repeat protein